MEKRSVIRLVLEGKRPPYVPWSFGFTKEAKASLQAHFGPVDLEEALQNHLLKLGSDIGFFADAGSDCVQDVFGVVWDRSVDKDIGQVTGQDVAVVDLDVDMGDVFTYFGREPSASITDLMELGEGADSDQIRRVGVEVAPHTWAFGAPPDPAAEAPAGEAVGKFLRATRGVFRYVVVDASVDYSDSALVCFDLSDVMFITTANLLDTIPPALQDRMEVIHFPGYTEDEKLHIATQYLVPKQVREHGLKPSRLAIEESALHEIVRRYTREAGVRGLERQIASICRQVARKVVEGHTGKIRVTGRNVATYLGPARFSFGMAEETDEVGTATGLVWTEVGGDVIFVEATTMALPEDDVEEIDPEPAIAPAPSGRTAARRSIGPPPSKDRRPAWQTIRAARCGSTRTPGRVSGSRWCNSTSRAKYCRMKSASITSRSIATRTRHSARRKLRSMKRRRFSGFRTMSTPSRCSRRRDAPPSFFARPISRTSESTLPISKRCTRPQVPRMRAWCATRTVVCAISRRPAPATASCRRTPCAPGTKVVISVRCSRPIRASRSITRCSTERSTSAVRCATSVGRSPRSTT